MSTTPERSINGSIDESQSRAEGLTRMTTPEGSAAPPGLRTRLAGRIGRRAFETAFSRLREGQVAVVDETGRRRVYGEPSPELPGIATLSIHDSRFYAGLLQGIIGAAEAFMAGHWSCDDLALLIRILVCNDEARDSFDGLVVKIAEPLRRLAERLRRGNTLSGSRGSIEAHYDLGNDFFESFLDPSLTYSAGIFEREGASMEEASLAKYDRLCRKLDLRPSDHVLEIGTGWGGFALHAANKYGCRVTTTTISQAQHERARERVDAAGLSDRVTLLLEDYRDLHGRYDKLVSIEMIEAVGHQHFDTFFRVCSERLEPHGLMALQAIAIRDDHYERARRTVDFTRKYIFPSGSLPSVQVMSNCIARTGDMRIVHLEDITPHYAETLRHWRERFLANRDAIGRLGYPEVFLRMWEFYLAYCEGGFAARRMASVQLLLAKPRSLRPPVLGVLD
jgi:cyclopropane-fatty-acyl-phospholipid synthase